MTDRFRKLFLFKRSH